MCNFKKEDKIVLIKENNNADLNLANKYNTLPLIKDEVYTISDFIFINGVLGIYLKERNSKEIAYQASSFRKLEYFKNISKEIANEFVEVKEKSDIEILESILN